MPIKNLINQKFGHLTVVKFSHSENGRAMWKCDCDCGNKNVIVKGKYLLNGDTKSCGCLNIERISQMGKDNRKYNNIFIKDNLVYVEFNEGNYFICDLCDLKYCYNTSWFLNNNGYARGTINGKLILFHNYIIDTKPFEEVDHIDGNRLNNTRSNLRVVNRLDNMKNKGKYINNTSGFTGVHYHKKLNKWEVRIQSNKTNIYLGIYNNFNDAVEVRKDAEIKYFGKFRRKREI